jgi:predicted kinase
MSAMEAVVLCGLQGAGKSTLAAERLSGHVCVSVDDLGSRDRAEALMRACVREGRPFVVDDVNATAADRAPWLQAAREAGYRVACWWIDAPASLAVRRNRARRFDREVPLAGIVGTRRRFEPPAPVEGWDELRRVPVA